MKKEKIKVSNGYRIIGEIEVPIKADIKRAYASIRSTYFVAPMVAVIPEDTDRSYHIQKIGKILMIEVLTDDFEEWKKLRNL